MSNRLPSPPASWSFLSDLVVVGSLGVWTAAGALVGGDGGLAGWVLGVPAVLFAPGYAFVAALFPRRRRGPGVFPGSSADGGDDGDGSDGSDGGATTATTAGGVTVVERLLMAVGTSVCLVPLIGLALHVSRVGIRSTTILGAIGTTTVALSAMAAVRRLRAPPDARFAPRRTASAAVGRERLRGDGVESVLTLLVAVGLVVAVAGMGLAAIDADRGEQFTEFYLTTEDPDTGEPVAGGYPDEIPPGETGVVQVGIANHEGETVEYTVAVYVESFDESGEVQEARLLDVVTVTVGHGRTGELDHEIEPEIAGEDLKVSYHLYRGTPASEIPETPNEEAAYRNTHIWVDVPAS